MRRVRITNLPMHTYVDAWVEIPDVVDLDDEGCQEAVAKAVLDGRFEVDRMPRSRDDLSVDGGAIRDGWEFTFDPRFQT